MPLSCSRRTTGDGAFAALGPARTSRAASTSAIWRRSNSISSISRRISAFSWCGSGRPSPVRAASSSCRRSLCSGLKSLMPCPASRPLMRFVCRIRLPQQYRALAAYPPTVFLFRRGRHDHRTDTRFSARPCQERSQKCLAVDRIRLGSPPAPRHCDGRWIDYMTFNAVCLKQPVDPKAVQSSFLDHHNLHRTPRQLLSPRPHALQQTEQRATITAWCRVLRREGEDSGRRPRPEGRLSLKQLNYNGFRPRRCRVVTNRAPLSTGRRWSSMTTVLATFMG